MHFRGLVIVPEAVEKCVMDAMAPHGGKRFDWFVPGGRYDGYFGGDDEMERRETHNGFNFDEANHSVERNAVLCRDVPEDRRAFYFFIEGEEWHACEEWDDAALSPYEEGRKGAFVPDENFGAKLAAALERNRDRFAVVVDAHN